MKKMLFSVVVTALFAALLISSCKKENDNFTTNGEAKIGKTISPNQKGREGEAAKFFEERGPRQQWFELSANEGGKFRLESGAVIAIPGGAFTVNGEIVDGVVRLSVLETKGRDDLAMAGLNTMNNAGILASDASFNIEAVTEQGIEVDKKLADGKLLRFQVPAPNGKGTDLFDGVVNQQAIRAQAPFNWVVPKVEVPVNIRNVGGSLNFNWPFTGWINCDVLVATNGVTTLRVALPGNPGPIANFQGSGGDGTFVLFAPKGLNSLVHIYTHTDNTAVTSYVNSMPVGMTGKLIGYSVVGGIWYYAEKEITISGTNTTTMLESLTLAPSSADEVEAKLRDLANY